MKSYQQFFAEMKRRKVFKVAGVYGIVSFGLLQVADPLATALGLPDTFLTYVVAILLLGFPLALVLAWAFEVNPDGVQRTGAAAPGEIEAMVNAPASQRWPDGLMALVGVAALLASGWWIGRRTAPEIDSQARSSNPAEVRLAMTDLSEDLRPSIAVLPFADMSPDGDQEYFSDGMTEEILNVLAKISELRVTARTSAFAFKDENLDLRAVGDSLGVNYLVEGSVRKAGRQLRITAQLIDTTDGSHLWSESYNRTLDDVFAIQIEIAEAIAEELRVPLGIADPAKLVTPTGDLEAYDLYLAGRARIRGRGQGLNDAIRLFEGAIARDSTWAPAWAGLAEATELLTWYSFAWDGGRPEELADELAMERGFQQAAEVAARRALKLDPAAAAAHVALGSVHRYRNEWDESEAEYLRALQIDPDNPEAFQQYSEMLGHVGRIAEALRTAERALALDRAPIKILIYANKLTADDRNDEAIEQLEQALALDQENAVPQVRDSWFYANLAAGRYEKMFEHAPPALTEAKQEILTGLRSGDLSQVPRDLLSPELWQMVGEPDRAAALLVTEFTEDTGLDEGYIWNPIFDPIRDHPAYLEALRIGILEGRTPQRTPR